MRICRLAPLALIVYAGAARAETRIALYGDMCIMTDTEHPKVRAISQPGIGTTLRLGETLFLVSPDDRIDAIVGTRPTDTEAKRLMDLSDQVRAACDQKRMSASDGRSDRK